tara:strand:+ start:2731 stop:3606 length:876 start_codon:yes stop_codon:yes gene_type:complete
MKHYTFIWEGSEAALKPQMTHLSKTLQNNHNPTMSWKDRTIQDRVCNYTGTPREEKYQDKYITTKLSESGLEQIMQLFGKKFNYTKESKTVTYALVPMFEFMALEDPQRYKDQFTEMFFTEDEYNAAIDKIVDNKKLEVKQKGDLIGRSLHPRTGYGKPDIYVEGAEGTSITYGKKCTSVFKPNVVLDDKGLEQAGRELNQVISGIDIQGLTDDETRLCSEWNESLKIYRGRSEPTNKESEAHKAWTTQRLVNIELKEVRKELGSVKRKMTTFMKKNDGIDFDLTPYQETA